MRIGDNGVQTLKSEKPFSGVEQRNFLRWPADFHVTYGAGDNVNSGIAVNMSEGGLSFRGPKLYPVGTQLAISLDIPNKNESLRLTAIIRRQESDGLHGVEFIGVTTEQKNGILDMLYHLITLLRQ
jgi:PilZ domain